MLVRRPIASPQWVLPGESRTSRLQLEPDEPMPSPRRSLAGPRARHRCEF